MVSHDDTTTQCSKSLKNIALPALRRCVKPWIIKMIRNFLKNFSIPLRRVGCLPPDSMRLYL